MPDIRLPSTTTALMHKVPEKDRNTGLMLDKFSPPGTMEQQKDTLAQIKKCTGQSEWLKTASDHRDQALHALAGTERFTASTAGPLTLHLSRTNALENAGLCLHPVYGFTHLPGSGLKGMTRAWAETVAGASSDEIRAVFGWAADGKTIRDSHAGSVIFHDALPVAWPSLRVEITNNHHPEYYQNGKAPGDWESPVPVYFLAVAPGTEFSFALTPARGCAPEYFQRALSWMKAALCHAGAGAKTAAGYGRFRLKDAPVPALPPPERLTRFETTLELVTPAFLAGAEQQKDDCTLHPGTLRGHLRWWWRTLHAAHVSLTDLQRVETLVWGGTSQGSTDDKGQGSAVALQLIPIGSQTAKPYDKNNISRTQLLPRSRDRRTVQGLFYASYGMDENNSPRRHYLPEKTSWTLALSARRVRTGEKTLIPASLVLRQAQAALWLLTRYGGVGSKARKGFGSLKDIPITGINTLEDCKNAAAELRQCLNVSKGQIQEAMAIEQALFSEKLLAETDPWKALDRAGTELQDFTKSLDKPERLAMGLPRKTQRGLKSDRHASPVWWHLAPEGRNGFTLRVTAFPAFHLPNIGKSTQVLKRLQEQIAPPRPATPSPTTRAEAAPEFQVGRKGRVGEDKCTVRQERSAEVCVEFDDPDLDCEWIDKSKFIPTP